MWRVTGNCRVNTIDYPTGFSRRVKKKKNLSVECIEKKNNVTLSSIFMRITLWSVPQDTGRYEHFRSLLQDFVLHGFIIRTRIMFHYTYVLSIVCLGLQVLLCIGNTSSTFIWERVSGIFRTLNLYGLVKCFVPVPRTRDTQQYDCCWERWSLQRKSFN